MHKNRIFLFITVVLFLCFFLVGCDLSKPLSMYSSTSSPTFTIIEVPTNTEMIENPTEMLQEAAIVQDTATPQSINVAQPEVNPTQISSIDGMILDYVPAGEFQMGSTDGEADEQPLHMVTLSAFWIDQFEVSNEMYQKCVNAHACSAPKHFGAWKIDNYYGNDEYKDFPVVFVNWNDAADYCRWAGRRLPTEAEWERAAKGNDQRAFPWGDIYSSEYANVSNNGKVKPQTIDSYPNGMSVFGVYNLSGNVWEWVSDFYSASYYGQSQNNDPLGPSKGAYHVLRGGSYGDPIEDATTTNRLYADSALSTDFVGFRCAKDE